MKRRSRLKRTPDELIIPDEHNGGKAKLMSTGVLECRCSKCGEVFWLCTNRAACCPVCADKDIKKMWTTPHIAFIPQKDEE